MDLGTRLLLKHLSALPLPAEALVLDTGCGTGVIGCCLKKHNPALKVAFRDMDALALEFTRMNLQLNHLEPSGVESGLLTVEDRRFDLIVSNLPAKAGLPVLEDFFRNCSSMLTPGGTAAVVIVAPLAETADLWIRRYGYIITKEEHTANHSVFFFIPGKTPGASLPGGLHPYLRKNTTFLLAGKPLNLQTVYGLGEFDTPSYASCLAAELLAPIRLSGSALFYNPAQGLLPCFVAAGKDQKPENLFLAGRNLLSLLISAENAQKTGVPAGILHVPTVETLVKQLPPKSLSLLAAFPDSAGCTGEEEALTETARQVLKPGGYFLVTGKSSDLARLEKLGKGFLRRQHKKNRGYRSILFTP
ncbi:MAG: methyltransferase [Spirochaetales bacterium]|nr:methyltransferase [Spirochaetales bacterium]